MDKEITLTVTTVNGEEYKYTGIEAKSFYLEISMCMDNGRLVTKEMKNSSGYVTKFVISNIVSTFYREV